MFDYWKRTRRKSTTRFATTAGKRQLTQEVNLAIGDGTAAFYNYVYQTIAGFTEHDTFRSNQIREGMITREQAMQLVSMKTGHDMPISNGIWIRLIWNFGTSLT